MTKPIENLILIFAVAISLFIVPLYMHRRYENLQTEELAQYKADALCWEIEVNKTIDVSLLDRDFTFMAYDNVGYLLDEDEVLNGTMLDFTNVKYLVFKYDGIERGVCFGNIR